MSGAQAHAFSFQDGARAVELAREAVEAFVLNGQREHPGSMRDAFYARTGALVRLEGTGGRLRGCAGAYEGDSQLGHAIVEATIQAASEDSCGSEIEAAELSGLRISVCIVTDVRETQDPEAELEVGRHGLGIADSTAEGWMYPTVPMDHDWSTLDYLHRTCRKVGVPADAWTETDVTVSLFEGNVYREREPEGEIQELTNADTA